MYEVCLWHANHLYSIHLPDANTHGLQKGTFFRRRHISLREQSYGKILLGLMVLTVSRKSNRRKGITPTVLAVIYVMPTKLIVSK